MQMWYLLHWSSSASELEFEMITFSTLTEPQISSSKCTIFNDTDYFLIGLSADGNISQQRKKEERRTTSRFYVNLLQSPGIGRLDFLKISRISRPCTCLPTFLVCFP